MGHDVNYIISIDDCRMSQFSKFGELSSICFYTPITYLGGKQHQVSGRFIGKKKPDHAVLTAEPLTTKANLFQIHLQRP